DLRAVNELDRDPTREIIDREFLSGVLGISPSIVATGGPLDLLRRKMARGQNQNTRLINFDWNEPMKSLRIQVDQDRVRELGVSSKSLSEALNAVTTGMVVTQVRDSIYLTDLVARSPNEQRESLQTLRNLQVALDNGQTIPLSQVATIQYKLEQ